MAEVPAMTRDEFLQALRRELSPLSPEERDAAVNYYEEFLADAEDEGVAIEKLGSPPLIAQRILQENGVKDFNELLQKSNGQAALL